MNASVARTPRMRSARWALMVASALISVPLIATAPAHSKGKETKEESKSSSTEKKSDSSSEKKSDSSSEKKTSSERERGSAEKREPAKETPRPVEVAPRITLPTPSAAPRPTPSTTQPAPSSSYHNPTPSVAQPSASSSWSRPTPSVAQPSASSCLLMPTPSYTQPAASSIYHNPTPSLTQPAPSSSYHNPTPSTTQPSTGSGWSSRPSSPVARPTPGNTWSPYPALPATKPSTGAGASSVPSAPVTQPSTSTGESRPAGGLREIFSRRESRPDPQETRPAAGTSDRWPTSHGTQQKPGARESTTSSALSDLFTKRESGHEARRENTDPAPAAGTNPWHKEGRPSSESKPERRDERKITEIGGTLRDVFSKRPVTQPDPHSGTGGSTTSGTPYSPPSAGGLAGFFNKPRIEGDQRPPRPPVPVFVIRHFGDPWYYPYDRNFYDNYCPYLVNERPYWGAPGYGYSFEDDFGLDDSADGALRDIARAWTERKFALIARHIDESGVLDVYKDGEYSHTMSAREFRMLTLQAFEDVRTVRFRFYDTEGGSGQLRAIGEHVFIGPDNFERRVEVAYTLRRRSGRWLITTVDLREDRGLSTLEPVDPESRGPAVSTAVLEQEVAADEALQLAAAPRASTPSLSEPRMRVHPWISLAGAGMDVLLVDDRPVRIAAARPARVSLPPSARPGVRRLVCLSTPLRLADLRAGAAPVKAATVTYIVQGTGARANFEIRVARTRSGLAWSIWHHGERAARNSGTVPVRSLKAGGFARVVIESVGRVAGTGQRIPLFVHPSWDFQAALQLLPKVPSRRPIRSELVIRTTAG